MRRRDTIAPPFLLYKIVRPRAIARGHLCFPLLLFLFSSSLGCSHFFSSERRPIWVSHEHVCIFVVKVTQIIHPRISHFVSSGFVNMTRTHQMLNIARSLYFLLCSIWCFSTRSHECGRPTHLLHLSQEQFMRILLIYKNGKTAFSGNLASEVLLDY